MVPRSCTAWLAFWSITSVVVTGCAPAETMSSHSLDDVATYISRSGYLCVLKKEAPTKTPTPQGMLDFGWLSDPLAEKGKIGRLLCSVWKFDSNAHASAYAEAFRKRNVPGFEARVNGPFVLCEHTTTSGGDVLEVFRKFVP